MRILIVEDDPMVRNINKGFLRKVDNAFEVHEAENIAKAKELINAMDFQLVLLDVYLGEDRGPLLLSWIREQGLDVDVILITADNSAETVEHAFRFGSIDYLIKPFSFDRFREAVNKARQRRTQLSGKEPLDQAYIDSMVHNPAQPEKKTMDKGINQMTYELILKALKEGSKAMTAQEIGEATDLARVTVRRYLEYMVEQGIADEMQQYGKVGRPQKAYVYRNKGGML